MKFARPMPYKEALASSQVKTLLPTSLGSKDLAKLGADILERARFSAKVRSAQHLSIIDNGVNDQIAGQIDLASARLNVKQFLRETGYVPPAGKEGTLQDFSSDRRIDLQLRMNTQMAQGYGWEKQGRDPDLLDAYPAREFVRVESRVTPRTDWPERWNEARAATITDGATDSRTGVMAALVGHPIWIELNVFGHDYEPFDYGSGYGKEDVDRARAIALGLLGRDTQIFPQERPFNADLQTSAEFRSEKLRAKLEATGVGRFNAKGVFVYQRGGTG